MLFVVRCLLMFVDVRCCSLLISVVRCSSLVCVVVVLVFGVLFKLLLFSGC